MYEMLSLLVLLFAAFMLAAPELIAAENPSEEAAPPKHNPENAKLKAAVWMSFDEAAPAWQNIDDVVMGGVSSSRFYLEEGLGVFTGLVSLENNGGFASVRSAAGAYDLSAAKGVLLRVRGDGKRYALRLRTTDAFSAINYEARFATKADTWITVAIPFTRFKAVRRGRTMPEAPPLDLSEIKTVGLLISERQAGPFRLEIDWIKSYVEKPEG